MLLFARTVFALIWIGVPLGLALNIPERFMVAILIICAYMLISHTLMTAMFRHLWFPQRSWKDVALIMLAGPIEINRLRRRARKVQQQ